MTTEMNHTGIHRTLGMEPFVELPLGSIKPTGWLRHQLEIQAEGLTGKLPDVWDSVSDNSGWLGGTGESWERGPYYADGLLPLAYLLQDETLIQRASLWVEWALSSQREDGWFGPGNNEDWWCRSVMLKVLIQHAEATDDERIVPFLTRYFHYQLAQLPHQPLADWAQARGEEHLIAIRWLYKRTGNEFLLDLAELLHDQSVEWEEIFSDFPFTGYVSEWDHRTHVVNIAMALKYPALRSLFSSEANGMKVSRIGIQRLMRHHGQVHGMFSGDEWLAGSHPSQGVELCAVVEYMFSLENLVRISGDGAYADILEKVAFNALPAAISPDWYAHQYDQQVNQIECSLAKRNWTQNGNESNLFGLEPNFGCCTANMHQGWPKFAAHLWMGTEDGGVACVSYAPCEVRTLVGNGIELELVVNTDYPFKECVEIQLELAAKVEFPLKLRIPAWCASPEVSVNGDRVDVQSKSGFATLTRLWGTGDTVKLVMPMDIRLESRANRAVGVQLGPLMFALPIQERWQKFRGAEPFADWEVYPESPWNYGIAVGLKSSRFAFKVDRLAVSRQPFSPETPPVKIVVMGRRIPTWSKEKNSAAAPPLSPALTTEPVEDLTLIPYGSARLRIAEFPTVKP